MSHKRARQSQRVFASGRKHEAIRAAARIEALENRILLSQPYGGFPTWGSAGAGGPPTRDGQTQGLDRQHNPVAGAIKAIAVNPVNANIMFVASVNGGIWYTDNALETNVIANYPLWTEQAQRNASLSYGDIAYDPSDPTYRTLWAGVGRSASYGRDGGYLTGVIKTTDLGKTWVPMGGTTLAGINIYNVVPTTLKSATNQQILMVAADGTQNTTGGVWRSTDGGNTFTMISGAAGSPLLGGYYSQLIADPSSPSRFWAAMASEPDVDGDGRLDGNEDTNGNGKLDPGEDLDGDGRLDTNEDRNGNGKFDAAAIYLSDNGGSTWREETTGISGLATANRIKLSIHNSPGSYAVYAGVIGPASAGSSLNVLTGVFRSTNQIWSKLGTAPGIHTNGQGDVHFSILADRDNPNVVYVNGDSGNPMKYDPATGNWVDVAKSGANGTGPHSDSRDMKFDANGNIIEADDGGLYRLLKPNSDDRTWESVNGWLYAFEFYSVARVSYTPRAHGFLEWVAGAQDNGTIYSNGGGFGHLDLGDGGVVAVDQTSDPTHIYIYCSSQQFGGFKRYTFDLNGTQTAKDTLGLLVKENDGSYESGVSILHVDGSKNRDFDKTAPYLTKYALNRFDAKRMIIGTQYMYESLDRGDHVDLLNGPLVNKLPDSTKAINAVTAIAYGGMENGVANADVIYVGAGKTLYVRGSGRGAPTKVTYPGTGNITGIALDPDNWQTAYLTDDTGKVYRTTDAGAVLGNWTDITGDLGSLSGFFQTIEIYKSGGTTTLLVGGQGGVYRSMSLGATPHWRQFGTLMPNVLVMDMHYDAVDDILYAGTLGRGIVIMYDAKQYFTAPAILTITGDFDPTNADDHFTLGFNPSNPRLLNAGGYLVEPGLLDGIVFKGGGGNDIYDINDTVAGIPVTIDTGTANALVYIGKAGDLSSINAAVTITGAGTTGTTKLVVDGQNENAAGDARAVRIDTRASGTISGLAPVDITYSAGARVKDVVVWSTKNSRNIEIPFTAVPTTVIGGSPIAVGGDFVSIGSGGDLAAILGSITYWSTIAQHALINLDADADHTARPILVDGYTPANETQFGRITGLAPAAISFRMSSIERVKAWTGFAPIAIGVYGDSDPGKRRVTVNRQPTVTIQNLNLDGGVSATEAPGLKMLGNTVGATTTLSACTNARLDGNTLNNLVLTSATTDTTISHNTIKGDVTVGSDGTTADRSTFTANTISGTVTVNGSADIKFESNPKIGNLILTGGTQRPVVLNNSIYGLMSITGDGASAVDIRNNRIHVYDDAAMADGTVSGNDVGWTPPAPAPVPGKPVGAPLPLNAITFNLRAPFIGSITNNDIHGGVIGLNYAVPGPVLSNRIFGNSTGVVTAINDTIGGFGYATGSGANDIFNNTTGVNLTGRMQKQHVYSNTTGVIGNGLLGPDTFDAANLIESNQVGADFNGTIQFTRFALNAVGIAAWDRQIIAHNLIYRGTVAGIRTRGADDVRIVHNTFYNTAGSGVMVDGGSIRTELFNNVFRADGGYDLNVADGSQSGFFSDYNILYSTGAGRVVQWLGRDFADILDFQRDLNQFDLHSIGTSPTGSWAAPQFLNLATDDYRIAALVNGQRGSSPGIDAGASFLDVPAPPSFQNLLANPSFEGGIAGWTVNVLGGTQTTDPFVYSGTKYFAPGASAAGFAQQTVDLLAKFTVTDLDSRGLAAVFGGRLRSAVETPADDGRLLLTFLDGAGNAIGTPLILTSNDVTDRWELVGGRALLPVGTRAIRYRFEATRRTGASNDAYLDGAFLDVRPTTSAPDQGTYGATATGDLTQTTAHIQLLAPMLYSDWTLSDPHLIEWQTFGNVTGSAVRITLYQDGAGGPQLIRTIIGSTPDTGKFSWIPESSGLSAGMIGLRIQVALVSDTSISDLSSEGFAIPDLGHTFYVNDNSGIGDEYTTALGSNRNTGRSPSSPKPSILSILHDYSLGALDTIYVDTGVYDQAIYGGSVVLSGDPSIGTGQGLTITGPVGNGHVAQINVPAGVIAFDLNAANLVTLSHLSIAGGTRGLWLHNGSTLFNGSFLTVSGASAEGMRIEADSTGAKLSHLEVSASGREGIFDLGLIDSLTDSSIHNNAGTGISLPNSGPVTLEANDVFGNQNGIVITNLGAQATVGNANLPLLRGNKVHQNNDGGIVASGNVLVAGNSVYSNTFGISHAAAGSVVANVVFDNYDGIRGGAASNNRVYHNSNAGLTRYNGSGPDNGNVVYSNGIGVLVNFAPNAASSDGPILINNMIYANSQHGIQLTGGRNVRIFSNTIYQPLGDAIRIDPYPGVGNADIQIRNNIFAVGSDVALNINLGSQPAVTSDYNDFYLFGSGKVGVWSGAARDTLQQWRLASAKDTNSLSQNPLFVDFDGSDNFLGYQNSASDGRDDDFHLKSTVGSFHGGALAPVIDAVTGLPATLAGSFVADGASSPLIDRGDPAFSYSLEPAPNGAFLNLGAYGNTAQASKSVIPFVTVTLPSGGEIRPVGQALNIQWRSQDTLGTVDLQLWRQGGASPVLVIATGTANDGDYTWIVPAGLTTASDYFIRVVRPGPVVGDSPSFSIAPATHFYYVNDDAALPGDVTTAPGSDTNVNNTGLDAAHPKASIQAVLDQYDLGPNDVILVDYGVYVPTNNIVITNQDSGVTIKGPDAASSSAGATYSTTILADAPTHYYRLGEASGTSAADSSGNGRTATYLGGVTLGQGGAIPNNTDTAAFFDGVNDHVVLPAGFATFPNGLSFEVWANPTANSNWSRFFDLGNGQSNNIVLGRVGASNDLQFAIVNGTTASGVVVASGALELNRWQYFAVTMTAAGAVAIYKNGVLLASGSVSVPNNIARANNYIGRSNYPADPYYTGKLDEAAFYDKVLTAAQVKARYLSTVTGATINRGNTATGAYLFELQNADNVTIANLALTGADRAIVAAVNSDSDNLTITNNEIYRNSGYGISIDPTNDNAVITGNNVHDQAVPDFYGGTGIAINGDGGFVSGNAIHDNRVYGIEGGTTVGPYTSVAVTLSGNDIYANRTGIFVNYGSQAGGNGGYTISGNQIHDDSDTDINLTSSFRNSIAINNTVYGAPIGINLGGVAEARGNVIYNHASGVFTNSGYVTGNRIYNNSVRGVYGGYGATVSGNRIYSNLTGIEGDYAPNAAGAGPYYLNNLVYANTSFGILLRGGRFAIIENNTIYQPTGDALRLQDVAAGTLGAFGDRVANNIFVVGAGYAMRVDSTTLTSLVWDYNDIFVTGTGKFARLDNRDFLTRAAWLAELGLDAHSITTDPQWVDPDGADNLLGYVGGIDSGGDDDFHVKTTSPTIDAGDPDSSFLSEPLPNGARVNQGNYGNTREAAASAPQFVQVLLPNGLERVDAGTQLAVKWRSSGLTQNTYIGLLNVGGADSGDWKAIPSAYAVSAPNTASFGVPVDTSLVTNPAPQSVYTTYTYANNGPGTILSYAIPVADGSYNVRLHWMEPSSDPTVGARLFDIRINGTIVRSNVDVRALAGASYKAIALSFPGLATAGTGLLVELISKTVNPAFLCGLEITAANPAGIASPTANLDYSTDGGATWSNIAVNQPMDLLGRGSFNWTVPNTPSTNVLIRVRANSGAQPVDVSDAPFTINSLTHDFYIDPAGDNANSGRAPDAPMASLAAILATYDFGPGDTLHVAAGTYNLSNTIAIDTQDSGVVIQGPLSGAPAIFSRGSTASPVFTFAGADDITLDHVAITGGSYGVSVDFNSPVSDRITLSNLDVYGNSAYGIYNYNFGATGWVVTNNTVHDNYQGIEFNYGANLLVSGNRVYNNTGRSITIGTFGGTISGNVVFNSGYGIEANSRDPSPAAAVSVTANVSYNNGFGISITSNVVADGNTVYGNTNAGILLNGGIARNNTAYANVSGFAGVGQILNNRAFNNSGAGIATVGDNAQVVGNTAFNNPIGIDVTNGYGGSSVRNNLVYNNATAGVVIHNGTGSAVTGNTIYQPAGDGIRLDGTFAALTNASIQNNIIQVGAGVALNVAANTGTGLVSDYNNFYATGAARFGRFGTTDFATRAQWFLEFGYDPHSISADPLFADPDGADDKLGYTTLGLLASYYNNETFSGAPVYQRAETQINALPGYNAPAPGVNVDHFSVRWQGFIFIPADGQWTFSGTADDGQRLYLDNSATPLIDQLVYTGVEVNATTPLTAGWHAIRYDWVETNNYALAILKFAGPGTPKQIIGAPLFSQIAGVPTTVTDDNFHLLPGSPSIDLGDPASAFILEPNFNGGRINQGHEGNTLAATTSPAQVAQILSPNGYDKLIAGKSYSIGFRLAGILAANPTASLSFSLDNGATWTPIASGVAVNASGLGSFNWTPSTATASNTALIRVVAEQGSGVTDTSDNPFLIANNGHDYYVNDGSTVGDSLTTAVGDNFNSGKSPDKPMAGLYALLQQYDLNAGDIVHIDNGTYLSLRDYVILPDDSGVRIQGPATGAAILNRNSIADTNFLFDFAGADDVTLDHLTMIGGNITVRLNYSADSDRITISNSEIFNSAYRGIFVGTSNDDPIITNNTLHDISVFAPVAIEITGGPRAMITGNTVYNIPGTGIIVYGASSPTTPSVISGNTVFGTTTGINTNIALVTDNVVRNNITGIYLDSGIATALNNLVYSNQTGIATGAFTGGAPIVDGNRIYNNSIVGVAARGGAIVRNNLVYSNAVGVTGDGGFHGQILSNLIEANANQGIFFTSASAARIISNTIYQTVGDAVRIQASPNITLRNNILYVQAGTDLFVAADSQTGFTSDYNVLYRNTGATGSWGGASRSSLLDWQTASGQDAHSIAGDPLFIDVDGPDNVLGYSTAGAGYDGGRDDNFYLRKTSPAIDSGDSWNGARSDIEGAPSPADDPTTTPNTGSPEYFPVSTGGSAFAATGTAQNFRTTASYFTLNLPFTFRFYGVDYTSVGVGNTGLIRIGGLHELLYDGVNATDKLTNSGQPLIAALWDHLSTAGVGNDVFVENNTTDPVKWTKIRWNATNLDNNTPVNFDVVLFADGKIRFDYGSGNAGLSPTIGISAGNGTAWQVLPGYDGAASLPSAQSVLWSFAPGFHDFGAYEFRGRASDNVLPVVVSTTLTTNTPTINKIGVTFSELLNAVDARSSANYQLRWAGPNGILGDDDDTLIPLTSSYALDSAQVILGTSQYLKAGLYRLTVFGSGPSGQTLRDLSGNRLDGDLNGSEGGNFDTLFTVLPPTLIDPGNAFDYASFPQKISLKFSADVGASLSVDDLAITGPSGPIPPAQLAFSYDPQTFTATWAFTSFPQGMLPDGNYRATLLAASVVDAAGNAMAANFTHDFFALAGDANHDRTVGFADLVVVAQNYGKTSGATWAMGDFNHDGSVGFADLVVVAQKYGGTLAIAAPSAASIPAGIAAPAKKNAPKSVFSTKPISKPLTAKPLARRAHR